MADKKKISLVQELRALDEAQLTARIAELKKQMVEHHRSLAANELPSAAIIKKSRRQVATALTILAEKQRSAKEQEK